MKRTSRLSIEPQVSPVKVELTKHGKYNLTYRVYIFVSQSFLKTV